MSDQADAFRTDLERRLAQKDLGHVELRGEGVNLRIDVVQAGQVFFWISFIAATDAEFETASSAKAAMRSFPWTMPFKPKLERRQATLPALCRWQRAYPEDTAALCVTLLTKHFRVPLETVEVQDEIKAGAKSQKVWLGDVTAWYMKTRA